jgi:peroxiredoxin Q/BCP
MTKAAARAESRATVGRKVPAFAAPGTGDRTIRLADYKGRNLVLYFYPKDNTSGCTAEGLDFKAKHAQFKRLGAAILGVSRDSPKSHAGFCARHGFPFDLLSDEDETVCRLFDVIRPKSLYGRKFMGIERSTFLIDGKGVLRREWRKVKVPGHADEVLAAVKEL